MDTIAKEVFDAISSASTKNSSPVDIIKTGVEHRSRRKHEISCSPCVRKHRSLRNDISKCMALSVLTFISSL